MSGALNFFRLMDNRCSRKSTIITTNLGFTEWGKFLANGRSLRRFSAG